MAPYTLKGKASISGSDKLCIPIDSDCIHDVRLLRPQKRLCLGHGNSKPTSFYASKRPKTTLEAAAAAANDDDDEGDPPGDEDYEFFLNALYSTEQFLSPVEEGKEIEGDEYMDPQYRMFMENLSKDKKSYMLAISREDMITVSMKYEGEDSGNGINWANAREEHRRNSKTPKEVHRKILKTSRKEKSRKSTTPRKDDKRNSTNPSVEDWRNAVKIEDTQSPEVPCSEPKLLNGLKMVTSDPLNCVTNRMDGSLAINSESCQFALNRQKLDNIVVDILAKRGTRPKRDNNDDVYDLLHPTNFTVKLEDDNDGTSAYPEKLPMNSTIFKKDVHHQWHAKRNIGRDHSQFREKLMEILRIPYNQEEYEQLLHEITDRKSTQHYTALRGQIKIYDAGLPAKSYLDHYSDLAKKIDLVHCDRLKVLNLLRGFFFWLMNLSHQGAFQPWLDSSCLKEILQDVASS